MVGLGAAPGVVHDAAVRGGGVLLQQPGECEGCLEAAAADAAAAAVNTVGSQTNKKSQRQGDSCQVSVPPTSSPWLCSAATSSPARGSSPPDEPPTRRASSPAAACSSSPPPRQQSATNQPPINFYHFQKKLRFLTLGQASVSNQPTNQRTHLEHELGCIQEVVGLAVELHRLQGFVLLQQVRGVLGEQRFDLLHVVGPGELHRLVPLWDQFEMTH